MTIATAVGALEYTTSRTYQLAVACLGDPITMAVHATYTALGHRRGGTAVTDPQLAEMLDVSTKTIQRARRALVDGELVEELRRGRKLLRRTIHPSTFIHIPGAAVWALMAGTLTAQEFRLYLYITHTRAETGDNAGCALTRAEIAADLKIRPDTVTRDVTALCAKGFLTRQGRTGMGWILTPKFAAPVRRRISATARYELADRRRRWGIPRHPGGPVDNRPPRPPVTSISAVRGRGSRVSTHPDAEGGCSPRSAHVDPQPPLERCGLNDGGPAPWDVDGTVWTPSPSAPVPRVSRPPRIRFPWDSSPPVGAVG